MGEGSNSNSNSGNGNGNGNTGSHTGTNAANQPPSYRHDRHGSVSSNASSSTDRPHSVVVPAYPYNVSSGSWEPSVYLASSLTVVAVSPFIPGSSSTRSESYFEQHVPDDSNVQTRLPSICVDYLSHDWQEDDVWTSWKAMTKHKSEIANGVRLENASWRTWAKQRGKLKTISPETLNWLKDSDVTWLYGPLHTAVDPVPAAKAATAEDYLGLDKSLLPISGVPLVSPSRSHTSTGSQASRGKAHLAQHMHGRGIIKPILKHRSLSDILSVPSSGAASPAVESVSSSFENSEDEGYDAQQDTRMGDDAQEEDGDTTIGMDTDASHPSDTSPRKGHKARQNSSGSTSSSGEGGRARSGSGSDPPLAGILRDHHASSLAGSASDSALANSTSNSAGDANASAGGTPYDLPSASSSSSSRSPVRRPSTRRNLSHEAQHLGHHRNSQNAHPPKKRHITFNHRVDQCISIDVEDDFQQQQQARLLAARGLGTQTTAGAPYNRYGGPVASGSGSGNNSLSVNQATNRGHTTSSSSEGSDDDDDEEEVLTFRSSSPRSPSFMKPFLSPSDPNARFFPGSVIPRQGGSKPGAPQPEEKLEPHTIAKLAPTTLKEFELLPGPTPIVVLEDGHIKALYGTEVNYVFDAEEHLGLGPAPGHPGGAVQIPPDRPAPTPVSHDESPDEDMQNDDFYNTVPSRSATVNKAGQATGTDGKSQASSAEEGLRIAVSAPQEDSTTGEIELPMFDEDMQDGETTPPYHSTSATPGSSSSTSANSSAAVSPAMSPGLSVDGPGSFGLSTSPSSFRGGVPTKSILKKRDHRSATGSDEYYPPVPPASTRASRAHAAMFADDDSDESTPYGSGTGSAQDTPPGGSTLDYMPNNSHASGSSRGRSADKFPPNAVAHGDSVSSANEPTRGRSISRGSSSSSLLDRVGGGGSTASLNSEHYTYPSGRTRSASGGHSLSPVPSYSPPPAASLNQLGTGTAVMQSQPVDIPRSRQRDARPQQQESSRIRNNLYDSEDDAAHMDFQLDVDSTPQSRVTGSKLSPSNSSSALRAANARSQQDDSDDDGGHIEHTPHTANEYTAERDGEDFDSRPTSKAANVGRGLAGLFARAAGIATTGTGKEGTSANAAYHSKASTSANDEYIGGLRSRTSVPIARSRDGAESEDEEAAKLFHSPFLPSTPTFASAVNLPSLAEGVNGAALIATGDLGGKDKAQKPINTQLRWSDKDGQAKQGRRPSNASDNESSSSPARASLLRTLSPDPGSPAGNKPAYTSVARIWRPMRSQSSPTSPEASKKAARKSSYDDGELSDPASNGYSYGFDLSDDDEEGQKGVVNRAVGLVGALWTVGSNMLWGPSPSAGPETPATGTPGSATAQGRSNDRK